MCKIFSYLNQTDLEKNFFKNLDENSEKYGHEWRNVTCQTIIIFTNSKQYYLGVPWDL